MKQIAAKLSVPFHEIMVDEAKELEAKVQLDIIKVYVETGDYANAVPLIEELEGLEDLLEYQRRELVLSKAECLLRTKKAEHAVQLLIGLQQHLELERETDDNFMATLYDKLGTAYYFLSNFGSAYANYHRAYQLSLRFDVFDLNAARICFNLGKICRMMNRYDEGVDYLSRAREFFSKLSDLTRLANTLFELGISFARSGNFKQAEEYLLHALDYYKSLNVVELARRVRQTYSLRVLSHTDPLLAIQELLENAKEYRLLSDNVRLAQTYASVAEIYLSMKNLSEAETYLTQATALFSEHEAGKFPQYAYVYQVYSKYLLAINDFEKCIRFSSVSSDIFDKMDLERDAADSLQLSVDAYRSLGQFEHALDLADAVNNLLRRSKDRKFNE